MKQQLKDLISVVTPCHNAEATITETVRSALGQTYANLEIVVVDDGSTDNSRAILSRLSLQDSRLRVIAQQNRGAGPARNHGLREARGEYVAFLDSDDYWNPACLEKLHCALERSNADIAYCGWQNVGLPGGRAEPFLPPDYSEVDRVELLLGGNRWPIHAALTRKTVIDEAGGFDENWSSCMDYDLWLRIGSSRQVVRVPEVLAFYRHHEGVQITKNRARGALNHLGVQHKYLAAHPDVARRLGRDGIRELTYGELLRRAYICYWDQDLEAARTLFRKAMGAGYGGLADWKYMLPALLPMTLHRALLHMLGRVGHSKAQT